MAKCIAGLDIKVINVIIDKTKLKKKDLDLIRQEKIILNLIKHENIISLKDYFEDKQNIYFISEFY